MTDSYALSRLLLATGIAGVLMWVLAGLWHKVIMEKFYARETHATHSGAFIILISYLCLSAIMSYMYPYMYKGGTPILEGARFGAIIGVLWVFPHELAMAGAHGKSIRYVFKNVLWHVVEQGFGGVLIGLVYGRIH